MTQLRTGAIPLCAFGLSFVVASAVVKEHLLLGSLANTSLTYLFSTLGLAALLVGLHCALFRSPVSALPLRANVVLFVIVAGAAHVDVVWDGVAQSLAPQDIWLALADSAELTAFYAAFLFLPRWISKPRSTVDVDAGGYYQV